LNLAFALVLSANAKALGKAADAARQRGALLDEMRARLRPGWSGPWTEELLAEGVITRLDVMVQEDISHSGQFCDFSALACRATIMSMTARFRIFPVAPFGVHPRSRCASES
jgi:hypothetical protein